MLTACLQLEICTGKRWPLSSKSWISNSSLYTHNQMPYVYFCMVFINGWSYICAYFYGWLFSMCTYYLDFAVSGQILNYWRMLTTSLMQTPTWTPSSSGFCSATIITWKLHRMRAFSPLVSTKLEATCPEFWWSKVSPKLGESLS